MKNIILICSFLFSVNLSAAGLAPVSIQRVNNTSLTCPAKKWCKVVVNFSQYTGVANSGANTGGAGPATNPAIGSFEVILKAGEVISSTSSVADNVGATANYTLALVSSITFTVASTTVGKFYSTCFFSTGPTAAGTTTAQVATDYSFYSMEYYY